MCFICNQQSGFETDLSKILQINQDSSLEVSEGINSNSTNKTLQSIDLITDWADDIKTDFAGLDYPPILSEIVITRTLAL